MSSTVTGTPPRGTTPIVAALLAQAERGLGDAEWSTDPLERFSAAYSAAVRSGAAVLAARGRPHRGRSRPTSVWVLLESAAPELGEWAAFFAAHSGVQAAAQAGLRDRVGTRTADDMLRQAAQFVSRARRAVDGDHRSHRKAS